MTTIDQRISELAEVEKQHGAELYRLNQMAAELNAKMRERDVAVASIQGELRALRWVKDQQTQTIQTNVPTSFGPIYTMGSGEQTKQSAAAAPARRRGGRPRKDSSALPADPEVRASRRGPRVAKSGAERRNIRVDTVAALNAADTPLNEDQLLERLKAGGHIVRRQLAAALKRLSERGGIVRQDNGWTTPAKLRGDARPMTFEEQGQRSPFEQPQNVVEEPVAAE